MENSFLLGYVFRENSCILMFKYNSSSLVALTYQGFSLPLGSVSSLVLLLQLVFKSNPQLSFLRNVRNSDRWEGWKAAVTKLLRIRRKRWQKQENGRYNMLAYYTSHWVGQNVHSGFSLRYYEKPKWTFLTNPIVGLDLLVGHVFLHEVFPQ